MVMDVADSKPFIPDEDAAGIEISSRRYISPKRQGPAMLKGLPLASVLLHGDIPEYYIHLRFLELINYLLDMAGGLSCIDDISFIYHLRMERIRFYAEVIHSYPGKQANSLTETFNILLDCKELNAYRHAKLKVYGRPYRERMVIGSAIKEIKKKSGTQFDPRVVEAFLRIVKKIDMSRYVQQNKSHEARR